MKSEFTKLRLLKFLSKCDYFPTKYRRKEKCAFFIEPRYIFM